MQVHFSQIYIEPGVRFPFSWRLQRCLSERITALVVPSGKFIEKYESDFALIFNVSAKRGIEENEIRGPTVFKKTKDVEYTVFLPFDAIMRQPDVPRAALRFLLAGTYSVLAELDIDNSEIVKEEESLIETICSNPVMFE